jgi:putative tryptophan/tyrosine transport system substrate-binding protein
MLPTAWTEKNINLVHRFPAKQPERFRSIAKELVASEVDVLVAVTINGVFGR